MNPEVELIIKARNEAKRALAELQKQLNQLEDKLKRTTGGTRQFGGGLSGLRGPLSQVGSGIGSMVSSLGAARLGYIGAGLAMLNFGREAVNAAAQMEGFRNTVRATEASSVATERRLAELTELGKELVGIDTGGLLKFNSNLRAIGIEASVVDEILRGFVKAGAELGRSVADNTRVLVQYTQAITAGKIQSQDLNTVFRELPQFARAASSALGRTVSNVESFREAAQAAGITAREALIRTAQELDDITRGADLDSYAAQVERLQESWFQLQAELGSVVIPVLADLVSILNQGVEATTDLTKGVREFIDTSTSTLSESGLIAALATATDFSSVQRAIAARVNALREERDATKQGTAEWNRLTFAIQDWVALGTFRGEEERTARIAELNAQLERNNRTLETNADIQPAHERNIKRRNAGIKAEIAALENLNKIFTAQEKANRGVTESTEKTETAQRNLRKEVVIAADAYRRAQGVLRRASAEVDINAAVVAAVEANQKLTELRKDRARESVKDKQQLEARLEEITLEGQRREQELIQAGLDKLVKLHQDANAEILREREQFYKQLEDLETGAQARRRLSQEETRHPLGISLGNLAADLVRGRLADTNQRQARDRANRIERDREIERQATALTNQVMPNIQRHIDLFGPAFQRANEEGLDAARAIQEMQQDQMQRQTDFEEAQLQRRLDQYRDFYELVRRLNFSSTENFIASTVRATSEYLQQLAIRKAAEIAFEQIAGGLGFAAGALTGGTGFAIAGGLAVGTGLISSLISQIQNENSRTFHNATNDALVEMAVNRAISSRSTGHLERVNNRQQARDVASAVDRGVRSSPQDTTPMEVTINVALPLSDQLIETITYKQQVLARRGQ